MDPWADGPSYTCPTCGGRTHKNFGYETPEDSQLRMERAVERAERKLRDSKKQEARRQVLSTIANMPIQGLIDCNKLAPEEKEKFPVLEDEIRFLGLGE
jgi:hypothetical protein